MPSVRMASVASHWMKQPFPPFIFALLNSLSPLALPGAAILAGSYTYMHRYADMMSAMSQPNFTDPFNYQVYDFVIVGGGSAGCVLANRLSRHNKVLLLEAGGNPHPISAIPMASFALVGQLSVDWNYKTVRQRFAAYGFRNNETVWPRGKSLGGSSVLNGMIYMRGNPNDFERWAQITGDDGWKYENLLPFFKKLENYKGHFPNASLHGTSGPVSVSSLSFSPGTKEWLRAARQVGYKVKDLNGYQSEGFMATEAFIGKGIRSDTFRSYVKKVLNRPNLTVSRFSHVIKIHLDRQRNAYGVTYIRHGIKKFVRANKEIIISAGAVNSPQLLMLSGIGPKKHLNSKGIRCRINLPVGQNLQDHVMTILGPITFNESISILPDRNISVSTGTDYLMAREGILGSIPAVGTATLSSSFASPSWPDLFVHQCPYTSHAGGTPMMEVAEDIFGFKHGVFTSYLKANEGRDANFVALSLGRPFSKGQITLENSDPFRYPLIDPKYLSDSRDVSILTQGIRKIINLFANSPVYQKMDAKQPSNKFPGCEEYEMGSDAYWECYVRTYTMTIYHPCCTARMGKRFNDTQAVLDSNFRLLKTRNLRVVDASAMSEIINANLNAGVIMMAERASFLLRSHWANQFLVCDKIQYFLNPFQHNMKCFYTNKV